LRDKRNSHQIFKKRVPAKSPKGVPAKSYSKNTHSNNDTEIPNTEGSFGWYLPIPARGGVKNRYTTLNITHFSAVMHDTQEPETLVEMDVSMAKFANVNVEYVRYFQTTDFTHLHRMSNLIEYTRLVYQTHGKDTRLMTLPQHGIPVHISMIKYFTRFRDDILQCAKLTCFEDITVKHLHLFMGKR
jgi:hypothetical protein